MGLPQRPFRSLTTNWFQLAVQLPAEAHDTLALPSLPLAPNWCARPYRPFTSLTTNAGLPPPAVQFPGPEHDKETTLWAGGALRALSTLVRRLHLPGLSLATKAWSPLVSSL
jgi:hypothetical protein